jgi:poly(beta-D-mannuronate) lyase
VGIEERNRIVRPQGVLILNNLVYCPNATELIKSYDNTDGIKLNNNLMIGTKGISKDSGTIAGEVQLGRVEECEVPLSILKAKKLPFVKYDILAQLRGESVIGAFQNNGEKPGIEIASFRNCGPEWYKATAATPKKMKVNGKIIPVSAGIDLLTQAIKSANTGDVLLLKEGSHIITKKIVISKDITICADKEAKSKPIVSAKFERSNGNLFELTNNATLRIDGIDIAGDSKSSFPAKYAFTAAKESAIGYSLFVNRCEIYDFNVETGAIFKAYKGSMADSITITNSVLRNSYRGFSLGEEKDDLGKYSAENLIFVNTVFDDFSQYIVDYYRGGNDESTLGGSFAVNHCVFNEIAKDEKQTIFKLAGIVNVTLKIQSSIIRWLQHRLSFMVLRTEYRAVASTIVLPQKLKKEQNLRIFFLQTQNSINTTIYFQLNLR